MVCRLLIGWFGQSPVIRLVGGLVGGEVGSLNGYRHCMGISVLLTTVSA